jgi:type IV pilus assembly protein PilA
MQASLRATLDRLRAKKAGDEGFTLIELLVVVVIIGVLVAIAVPVYLNYRAGAADKSAQSDVRGAISAIEQYYTDNNNSYPAATFTAASTASPYAVGGQQITLSDKTTLTYVPVMAAGSTTVATTYRLCATNSGGSKVGTATKVYLYDSSKGGSVTSPTPVVKIDTCAV